MTLIRSPFKKRVTITADDSTKPSPLDTPKSLRSNKRSSSVLSSVNSLNCGYSDDTNRVVNCANNIYADIDESCFTNQMCANHFKVPVASECESFEECVEDVSYKVEDDCLNHSKNNLLEISSQSFNVMSSIDCHLDQIDTVNRNLDEMLIKKPAIQTFSDQDDFIDQNMLKKRNFKEKIEEKYKNFVDLKFTSFENSECIEDKNSLTSKIRFKFSKQNSRDNQQLDQKTDVPRNRSKSIFMSFRGKKAKNEPQEECFENILNVDSVPFSSNSTQVTDLDMNEEASGTTLGSKGNNENTFKQHFKNKIKFLKLPKSLTKNNRGKDVDFCRRCSKQLYLMHESKTLLDFTKQFQSELLFNENNDYCVCVADDDVLWYKSRGIDVSFKTN